MRKPFSEYDKNSKSRPKFDNLGNLDWLLGPTEIM